MEFLPPFLSKKGRAEKKYEDPISPFMPWRFYGLGKAYVVGVVFKYIIRRKNMSQYPEDNDEYWRGLWQSGGILGWPIEQEIKYVYPLSKEEEEYYRRQIISKGYTCLQPRELDRASVGGADKSFVVAAYGDAHHPMVEAFRSLRDEVLVNHKIGRAFTKVYNKVGPVAADFIREKPMVCAAARAVLTPLAKTVQFARGISAEKRQGPN